MFLHEQLHRTQPIMERLKQSQITICGAGALGANLTENLARSGLESIKVIDRDRVEERNLSTQPYYRTDIGMFKVKALANALYRAIGIKLEVEPKELTAATVKKLLPTTDLVIDTFDNSHSRQMVTEYCTAQHQPCLHVGLATDYAEIIWNAVYRVPSEAQEDRCDYPLARNLVMLTMAIASEVIIAYLAFQRQQSYTITLDDLTVSPLEL